MSPPLQVLYVEDSTIDAAMVQRALFHHEKDAFDLTLAGTAGDALGRLRERRFDAILLDLMLPDLSGDDLVTRIRAAAPVTPLVVLTGSTRSSDERLIQLGVQDVLIKGNLHAPTIAHTLRAAVHRGKADEAAREIARRFKAFADNATLAAFILDSDASQAQMANDRAGALLGVRAGEKVDIVSLFHPDDRAVVSRGLRQIQERGTTLDTGARVIASDGKPRTIRLICFALPNDDHRLGAIGGLAEDVTLARKQAEDLRRAHSELKGLQESRSRMLNGLAHDIASPLMVVQLQVESLARAPESLPPPARKALDTISRNLQAMTGMFEDLRVVATLEAGKLALNPRKVDAKELLQAFAESIAPIPRKAEVALEVDVPAPIVVKADPRRIERVLTNLVTNAVKFTPAGGRVRLSAQPGETEATIRVMDTGRGIAPEDTKRLFQPFTQVHLDKDEKPGSGLGLYVSRGIVEAHGGKIGCESEGPGKGTTIWFTLPVWRPPG